MSILNPINDLVAWVIMHIYDVLTPVFGATSGVTWVLSIVILVVLMRLLMVPLFIKQMHTQRAMTALTPRISELRKKYKGDKETLNAETMKLYQEAGVNPLMGCLPVVLQMPLFFALFSVLRAIASAKHPLPYHLTQSFVTDVGKAQVFGVSIKDTFLHATALHIYVVIGVVVLTSMATTYLTVRQSMKRGMMPTGSDNPMGQSQKFMAYVMPLFALTGLYWPFGLVFYWVTTNLWTLGQQYVLLRKYPVGAAAMGPAGNLPIKGTAGRPATATGFTGGPAKATRPKPSGGGAGGAGDKAAGPGAKAAGPGAKAAGSGAKAAGPGAKAAGTAGKTSDGAGRPAQGSANGKPAPGDKVSPERPAKSGGAGSATGASGSSATNGHKPEAGEGGKVRRFGRNRSEPEPSAAAEPETKIVRQQRQRQSRSKRSGKR